MVGCVKFACVRIARRDHETWERRRRQAGLPTAPLPMPFRDAGHNVTLCAGLRWFSPLAFSGSLHPERREPWPLRRRAAAATSSGETVRLGDLTVSVRAPDSSAEAVGDPAPSSRSAHPRPLGIHFHILWYRPKEILRSGAQALGALPTTPERCPALGHHSGGTSRAVPRP